MELTRKTLAKALVAAFVFNLIVMGAGAIRSRLIPP
jgi:hypothetical protein